MLENNFFLILHINIATMYFKEGGLCPFHFKEVNFSDRDRIVTDFLVSSWV